MDRIAKSVLAGRSFVSQSSEDLPFECVPGCREPLASDGFRLQEVSFVNQPYGNSLPFFFLQGKYQGPFFWTPCGASGFFPLTHLQGPFLLFPISTTLLWASRSTRFMECRLAQFLKMKLFILSSLQLHTQL